MRTASADRSGSRVHSVPRVRSAGRRGARAVRHAAPVVAPDGLRARVPAARAFAAAADPQATDQWPLDGDRAMGMETAWQVTTGGEVVVAVIDSGADLGHPDLAPNLWVNPGEVAGNGVDDDGDGVVDDVHGIDFVDGDGRAAGRERARNAMSQG